MTAFVEKEKIKPRIARRIAREFLDAETSLIINLGVGTPTMVSQYLTNGTVYIQAENGMLGVGPLADETNQDPYLINAGRQMVTETPGCSYFDSALSFGMIRGGHVDVTVIGAFEVDAQANIANWIIPNGRQLGVGGAMDLVTGAKRVIVGMPHFQKNGQSKIVESCTFPITGLHEADLIVTELGVFDFPGGFLTLEEIAPELDVHTLRSVTRAEFRISDQLRPMATAE
ncbi:3-oxoacid CoA-transferase subunit B [Desulfospira joergensenii]|uniref:3-oxoacid CoA-transferase subunit B n=1 Tax=Desulfospira joergensenii TaxID=53329 RepID=UPI0003B57A3E|nr:3-oxoacid CoA-transferase subunit B [Desulfospira joergensenii]